MSRIIGENNAKNQESPSREEGGQAGRQASSVA
jgi:hypothetical protein